ncbi:6874_t:CDS:2, partial [Dentiscutata erythropus]
ERDDIFISSSSLNNDSIFRKGIKELESTYINQAKEFIKDFSELDNLVRFKQLVENFEIELPEDILIKAVKLLSDALSFEYHSENTMIRLEVHLQTWIATLERVYYSPVVLGYEIHKHLYKNLSDFVDFHHRMINAFKQGVSKSFKQKGKSKEIPNNEIYMYFQNYNINFLLIHLSAGAASENISEALGIAEILPNIAQVFKFKYPLTYWYSTWRELLSIHYLLENLTKDEDYSKLRFYNETYLLELLCQCIFDLSINQKVQNEILNSQNETFEFMNLWTKKEPTAPTNSLWFGILDLVQRLSQQTTQVTSLALCYYLGLESLQNSKCNYICFKSLELLLSLSYQNPELFNKIVKEDINEYKESLSAYSQQILEKIIHDVDQKLQLNLKFMNQLSMISIKENSEIKGDRKLILNIIADELICPITKQITGDFSILTCGHSISCYSINKWKETVTIESRLFECPYCKKEIDLNSTYNLQKNKILESLYVKLKQAEDDLFLKFNKHKMFQSSMLSKLSTPIFKKVQPKVMLPAFNKVAKAEQQNDYDAVIM